jgi:hypothetical protein
MTTVARAAAPSVATSEVDIPIRTALSGARATVTVDAPETSTSGDGERA